MKQWFIGWDTGAWYTKSKEAFWILDADGKSAGHAAFSFRDVMVDHPDQLMPLLDAVGEKCGISGLASGQATFTIAIDAPFGFPKAFRNLLAVAGAGTGRAADHQARKAIDSPYLYRETERFVAKMRPHSNAPLSALQDSIGSQATKAMHFLRRYGFDQMEEGVWSARSDDGRFQATAIEVYPATCKRLKEDAKAKKKDTKEKRDANDYEVLGPLNLKDRFSEVLEVRPKLTLDERDAFICAHLARVFAVDKDSLHAPADCPFERDKEEGWIWFPRS